MKPLSNCLYTYAAVCRHASSLSLARSHASFRSSPPAPSPLRKPKRKEHERASCYFAAQTKEKRRYSDKPNYDLEHHNSHDFRTLSRPPEPALVLYSTVLSLLMATTERLGRLAGGARYRSSRHPTRVVLLGLPNLSNHWRFAGAPDPIALARAEFNHPIPQRSVPSCLRLVVARLA